MPTHNLIDNRTVEQANPFRVSPALPSCHSPHLALRPNILPVLFSPPFTKLITSATHLTNPPACGTIP
jgi:hypothetical protein